MSSRQQLETSTTFDDIDDSGLGMRRLVWPRHTGGEGLILHNKDQSVSGSSENLALTKQIDSSC